MDYLLFFASSALAVMILCPLALRLAKRWGMMDQPDPRKVHQETTPCAGGLVLFPVILAALIAAWAGTSMLPFLAFALVIIFLVGLWDDAQSVHYATKFFTQTTAALVVVMAGVRINFFHLPFIGKVVHTGDDFLNALITVVWIVGITNALNLIDGLDGLAAGLSINALLSVGVIAVVAGQTPVAIYCFILAGGVFGFLRYNLHPAKTFLGDSGSLLLGFSIAVMSVIQSSKTATFLILAVPVLFVAIPMADTLLAFVRRMYRGAHPFKPDREHLHHRLLDMHFSPQQTLGYFYGFSALLGLASLAFAQTESLYALVLSLLLLILMIIAVRGLQIINFHRIISRFNDRVMLIESRARGRGSDDIRILVMRALFLLLVLYDISAAFLVGGEARVLTISATLLAALMGGRDIVRLHREKPEHAFAFTWMSIFLLLVVGCLALSFANFHKSLLGNTLLCSFLLLAGVIAALFFFRRKRYDAFLIDPVVLLPFYLSVLACGLLKHFSAASSFLPFAFILVNTLLLLFFFNIFGRQILFRGAGANIASGASLLVLTAVSWLI